MLAPARTQDDVTAAVGRAAVRVPTGVRCSDSPGGWSPRRVAHGALRAGSRILSVGAAHPGRPSSAFAFPRGLPRRAAACPRCSRGAAERPAAGWPGRPPARPRRGCWPPPRRWQAHGRILGSSAAVCVAPAAHVEHDFAHLALSLKDPRSWDTAAEQVLVAGQVASLLGDTCLVPRVPGAVGWPEAERAEPAHTPRGRAQDVARPDPVLRVGQPHGGHQPAEAATMVSAASSGLFLMSCTGWPSRCHHCRSLQPLGPLHETH